MATGKARRQIDELSTVMRSSVVAFAIVLGSLAMYPSPLAAQKTDVVTLQNGDKITGEIKRLERGRLEYSTDDMGTLNIEWGKIAQLTSVWYFEVELRSGEKHFGTFSEGAEPGTVIVAIPAPDTLPMASIVRITPIEASFWERLSGFIDVGFDFARANRSTQLTLSGRVRYRGRRWGATAEGSSYFQDQEEVDRTTRNNLSFSLDRFFGQGRWSGYFLASGEQNEELGLALRGNFGIGISRQVLQTNSSVLVLGGGAVLNRERFEDETNAAGEDTTSTSAEAVVRFEWGIFRFDSPELDLLTKIDVYTSITDFGRVRADGDLRIQYEVIKDFFTGLTLFATLDSRPPTTDATKLDYGIQLTVGWSY